MNITDIDDKIILKARQKHLLLGAISQTTTPEQAHSLLTESLAFFLEKNFRISLPFPVKDLQEWHSAESQLLAKSFADSEKFKKKITWLRLRAFLVLPIGLLLAKILLPFGLLLEM